MPEIRSNPAADSAEKKENGGRDKPADTPREKAAEEAPEAPADPAEPTIEDLRKIERPKYLTPNQARMNAQKSASARAEMARTGGAPQALLEVLERIACALEKSAGIKKD